jgi:hypothetical protein
MALAALKVRGLFKGPTDYEHHVREFVRELHNQGVAIQLIDLPLWGPARLPVHLRDAWFDSLGGATRARAMLHARRPLYEGGPEALLPAWALAFYRELRRDLLGSPATAASQPLGGRAT